MVNTAGGSNGDELASLELVMERADGSLVLHADPREQHLEGSTSALKLEIAESRGCVLDFQMDWWIKISRQMNCKKCPIVDLHVHTFLQ